MAVYAAQIDCMDQNIGRLFETLKATNTADNTLILFLADNGGCAEVIARSKKDAPVGSKESYLSYGEGWATASNTPFRLHKSHVHEGGIATPFLASWPGVIKPNTSSNQAAHVIDILPTLLEAANTPYPKQRNGQPTIALEGKSLMPLFKGNESPIHDVLFFEHQGNRAIREGNFKLVSKHPGDWELYDLSKDRTETNNLAKDNLEEVTRLENVWQEWATKSGVRPWPLKQNP